MADTSGINRLHVLGLGPTVRELVNFRYFNKPQGRGNTTYYMGHGRFPSCPPGGARAPRWGGSGKW